jgi:hypothetical protein
VVAPLLDGTRHGAALLGEGSEVLGFDDEISQDHDFGARVQIFLPEGTDRTPVRALLTAVPMELEGFAIRYQVTTVDDFVARRLGVSGRDGLTVADWLLAPTQRLRTLTAGAVFADPDGELAARRAMLDWYPDDVWRYVLAAGWQRVAEESPFVARAAATSDLGSRVIAGRLVRDLMRLAYLVERSYPPYAKWFGRGFADLALAATVGPHFDAALAAPDWRDRETALCSAASLIGEATNALGLARPVDCAPRQFFTRDIRVIDAGGLAQSLATAITEPVLRQVLHRLDGRPIGGIDHVTDSVYILDVPDRCRAAASILGL